MKTRKIVTRTINIKRISNEEVLITNNNDSINDNNNNGNY